MTMAELSSVHLPFYTRTICCHIRTVTLASALCYLIYTVATLMLMLVGLIIGTDVFMSHTDLLSHKQHIFEDASNVLLLVVMFVSSVYALHGLRKNSAHHLLPFITLLFMDVTLTLLSLFSGPWGLPGTPNYESVQNLLKSVQGGKDLLRAEETHFSMIFSVLFTLYLLMKVYVTQVTMRCYFVMKGELMGQELKQMEKGVLVQLPSYDEALELPGKDQPPCYREA